MEQELAKIRLDSFETVVPLVFGPTRREGLIRSTAGFIGLRRRKNSFVGDKFFYEQKAR